MSLLVIFLTMTVKLFYLIFLAKKIITESQQLWPKRSLTEEKHHKTKKFF